MNSSRQQPAPTTTTPASRAVPGGVSPAARNHRALLRSVFRICLVVSPLLAVLLSGGDASAATAPPTPTITVRANTRLRFVGSNVQCIVAANERSVPFDIDCFVDKGNQGQLGAYHAALDGDNQARFTRTTISGIHLAGGIGEQIWSDPEKQHGTTDYVESTAVSVRLGDVVRIGATNLYCLYQISDVIDTGAPAVACMYVGNVGSSIGSNSDDLFRVTADSAAQNGRHAIFVSNRVAAVLALHEGSRPEVLFQRSHFR